MDGDPGGEVFAEAVDDGADHGLGFGVEVFGGPAGFGAGLLVLEVVDELLGAADGEFAADDLLGGGELARFVLDAEDGLGVTDGEAGVGEEVLDVFVEVEEAHGVGDGGAGLADALGDFLLFEAELACEAGISGSFLDGVEVGALEVFDEGHFEDLAVGGLALDDGDGFEAEFSGGAPAAFAGDEFELSVDAADDEGLDDAVLADRLEEFVEGVVREAGAGLEGAGDDLADRNLADLAIGTAGRGGGGKGGVFAAGCLSDQRPQSFSQRLPGHGWRG